MKKIGYYTLFLFLSIISITSIYYVLKDGIGGEKLISDILKIICTLIMALVILAKAYLIPWKDNK